MVPRELYDISMNDTDLLENSQFRTKLRAIPGTCLSDSYIEALPIDSILELLIAHEQGNWPPSTCDSKL